MAQSDIRTSDIVYVGCLVLIPFIVTQTWFFYLLLGIILTYSSYHLYQRSRPKITVNGQGVFITGCDSGFGFGLAKRLDAMGFNVFAGCFQVHGEGAQTLMSSSTGRMHVIPLDVTKDESVLQAVQQVRKITAEKRCALWTIVNNAGIQVLGEVEFCTMDLYYKVAEVNLFGMVRVTKAFLPIIRKNRGRVINITSVKGLIGSPFNAAYGITKYGGETFSDILRLEMRKFGVKVIIVEPGHFGGVTGILNSENLSRLKKEIEAMWDAADAEVKETYGKEYYDVLYKGTVDCKPDGCPSVDPVCDAFVDALTSRYPQYRYLVDGGSGYFDKYCIMARLNMYLPTFVMDLLNDKIFLSGMPSIAVSKEKSGY